MSKCVICEEECNSLPTNDGSLVLQAGKAIHYRCLENIWSFYNQQPATMDLRKKLESLEKEIEEFELFHPRAVKLLRKRKEFLVVSETEKYYLAVYQLIRGHERASETWTSEDEEKFQRKSKETSNEMNNGIQNLLRDIFDVTLSDKEVFLKEYLKKTGLSVNEVIMICQYIDEKYKIWFEKKEEYKQQKEITEENEKLKALVKKYQLAISEAEAILHSEYDDEFGPFASLVADAMFLSKELNL